MHTETSMSYDVLRLYVLSASGEGISEVWNKEEYDNGGPHQQWRSFTVDLSAWAGETIELQWTFETGDPIGNEGEGVYIDDISVGVPCDLVACTEGCDDGQPCTLDFCVEDICSHALEQCDDGNVCTLDYCDNTVGCVGQNIAGVCDDGDACTVNEECVDGACVGGPTDCDDGEACTLDSCDALLGCQYDTLTQAGVPCDDGSVCSLNDLCVDGVCVGDALDCTDGDACTLDLCDDVLGCIAAPFCNDGNTCTTDICDDSGEFPTCDFVTLAQGTPCNDFSLCFVNDLCDEFGICVGEPVSCEDGNACTFDFCEADIGCINDSLCDDGIDCTVDSCDPLLGCGHQFQEGLPCDDGLACTANDTCNFAFGCSGEDACNDNNPCTIEGCDFEVGQCVNMGFELVETPCDDGDSCTVNDSCDGLGTCLPGTFDCYVTSFE
jgi:hypothetical protein